MISVIIPVYNGENYMERCLSSITKQSFSDMEIILVDDGSKDHSAQKIHTFFHNLERPVKYRLISQENQGQGAARTRGLQNSEGKYVVFVDQDDYLVEDFLEKLYTAAERDSADAVVSGYSRVSEQGRIIKKVPLKNAEWSKYCNITPWGKIYRRDYLERNQISFLPVALGEDVYFTIQVYTKTDRLTTIDYVGYCWVDNKKSLSNTAYKKSSSDLFPLLDSLVKLDNFQEWCKNPFCEYFIWKTVIWFILYTAPGDTGKNHYELCRSLYRFMAHYFPAYLHNPYIGLFRLKEEKFYLRFIVWFYKAAMITRMDKFLIYVLCRGKQSSNDKLE